MAQSVASAPEFVKKPKSENVCFTRISASFSWLVINFGVKKLLGWLLQQKVFLGLSENMEKDIIKSLNIAKEHLVSHELDSIDAMALESSNQGLLGNYLEACSKVSTMNEILNETKSKAVSHEYAMTAWINQNCENYEIANLTYEDLFKVSPHYPAWVLSLIHI